LYARLKIRLKKEGNTSRGMMHISYLVYYKAMADLIKVLSRTGSRD